VNIELIGDDPQQLRRLARDAVGTLRASPVFARLVGSTVTWDARPKPRVAAEAAERQAAIRRLP
jgi:hypothetical protein